MKELMTAVQDFASDDLKYKEILNIANQCVDIMINISSEHLDKDNEILLGLINSKKDINNIINQSVITKNQVVDIINEVLSYKEKLEFLGMFFSGIITIFPLFHMLSMFI